MKREMVCVACPLGCGITVELSDSGEVLSVKGNTCKRGEAYAHSECTNPTRSLTSTVKVSGSDKPVIPVKSAGPIPKAKLIDCAFSLRDVTVKAPVQIGDVVVKDVLGTGVDIIATNFADAE